MRYLSVCSGIEAATVAWAPLGWRPVAFAEIDKFPSAVLRHHYPRVPNWGDITKFEDWIGPCTCGEGWEVYGDDGWKCARCGGAIVDVLVGGTPCQSYSIAGLREGLADPRGQLALVLPAIAARYRPLWVVWENVAGVLSSGAGSDFGSFLGILSGQQINPPAGGWQSAGVIAPGTPDAYGVAWRVLDAQYFGLAQRRARVFVVGCLGDWRRAAAVLLEQASMCGHPAPRRETGQSVAGPIGGSAQSGGFRTTDLDNSGAFLPVMAFGGNNTKSNIDVATAVRAKGGTGHGDFESETFVTCHAFTVKDYGGDVGVDLSPTLRAGTHSASWANGGVMPAVAIGFADVADPIAANQANTYTREGSNNFRLSNVAIHLAGVRRLTPLECERLQGFPDGYTLVNYNRKPAKDGPRYKAIGNSMPVPVMRWVGQRIASVMEATRHAVGA